MLDALVTDERVNAAIGWGMAVIVLAGAVGSVFIDSVLWGAFSVLLVGVTALPALTRADWTAMVPWPVPALAAVAVTARATGLYSEAAGYLAIVALALLVVVELDAFTPVELGRRFAVAFAVLTTMALEALWIVAQFSSDRWLGTEFLTTQTELQEDIVIVTVTAFAVGGLFYWYFARFEPAGIADRNADRVGSR